VEILKIKNLSFNYLNKEKKAISNLNFSLKSSEFAVIMGESGAGKSTFLFTICGIVPNFFAGNLEGNIYFLGKEITFKTPKELAGEIGIVFQDFETQLFSTSVELEISFLLSNLGFKKNEIKERVKYALEIVGLKNFDKRNPLTLSGGEKQKLAIASVICCEPKLLLLDEPTTDLDPLGKEEIFRLAKILKEKNNTVILVEHETESINFADRIILMKEGNFLKEGKPEEIVTEPDLLKNCGVRPLFHSLLFKELKIEEIPLNIEDAYLLLKERFEIVKENYQKIVEEDLEKENWNLPIIQVKNLSFSYQDKKEILKEINLEIKKGEFIAIIGENGCGKTTLVKHFNRLLLPEKGEVIIKGIPTYKQKINELAKIVGYVFQNPDHQIFANTVYEEISFAPRNSGIKEDEIKDRVREALEAVELKGYEKEDPFSLTKGERQRIAVASVLAQRPEILIFDEPTTGLDYSQTLKMMELIKKLNKMGYTIIIITHSMWIVGEYAKRIILMKDGKILLEGKPREVFKMREKLKEAKISPPPSLQLSEKFGVSLLSILEWKKVLRRKEWRSIFI
jgi:energy-coupling factor transport system ATP-binding protein